MKHKKFKCTPEVRARLMQAAEYIRTVPQKKFDMNTMRSGSVRTPECKSVGCFLGHITRFHEEWGVPLQTYRDYIDFTAFSEDALGVGRQSETWAWLFSGLWSFRDNTPEGAAKRACYLLDNGLPDSWRKQLAGEAELSYR